MSRSCDAIGCNADTASGMFMCLAHWRKVPAELKTVINTQYRAGRKNYAFLSDVVYLKAAVDAVDAVALQEDQYGANPYLPHLVGARNRQARQEGQ